VLVWKTQGLTLCCCLGGWGLQDPLYFSQRHFFASGIMLRAFMYSQTDKKHILQKTALPVGSWITYVWLVLGHIRQIPINQSNCVYTHILCMDVHVCIFIYLLNK